MPRTRALIAILGITLATTNCASGGSRTAAEDLRPLAVVQAELRLVGSETTWVARGVGYELVARSGRDLAQLNSSLQAQGSVFRDLFGVDPANVVVAVHRVTQGGERAGSIAPVPTGSGPVIEAIVGDAPAAVAGARERPGRMGGAPRGMMPAMRSPVGTGSAERLVARAWLSQRASDIAGRPAAPNAVTRINDDPRVPDWAEDAIVGMAADSQVENLLSVQLAAQLDSLYPLSDLFQMLRPPEVDSPRPAAEDMGRGRGGPPPGGGGRGGMGGGMGGMGGGRGGAGRGPGGGMPPRFEEQTARLRPLQGGMLFSAQSMLFGRYLAARENLRFAGAFVDLQLQSRPITELLSSATRLPGDLERLESDWRNWIVFRARNAR